MGLLDDAIREHLDLKRRRGADPTEIEKAERDALGPVRRDPASAALSDPERPVGGFEIADETDDFGFAASGSEDEHPTMVAPRAGDPIVPVDLPAGEELPYAEDVDEAPAGFAPPDYTETAMDDFAAMEQSEAELPPPPADFDLPSERPIEGKEPKHKRRHLFGRHRHDHEDDVDDFSRPSVVPPPVLPPEDDPFLEDPVQPTPPRDTVDGETVGRAQPIQREVPPHEPPPALQITSEPEPGHTVEYDVEKAFAEEDAGEEDILEETPDFLADTPDHDRLWFEQKPPPDFDFDA